MSGTNSAVDPNVALQAGRGPQQQQQQNPLQQIEQFAVTKNLLNSNQMFPGELQRQQQQIQLGNQAVLSGQVDMQSKINQAVYGAGVPLLAKPAGSITHDDVTSWLGSAEGNLGLPTNGVIGHILQVAPKGDGPAFDAMVRSLIAAGAQPYQNAASQVTPQPGPIYSNGQSQIPSTVAPAGSPNAAQPTLLPGAGTPVWPSRSELAAQVGRPANAQDAATLGVPVGTPLTETMAQRLQAQGAGGLAGPAGVVGINGPVSPQNAPRLTAPPRAVATGMAPTAPSEMAASTDQYNAASAASNTFQQRVFPLQQAAAALKNTNTGPGTETVNQIKSFLLAQSPTSLQKYLPGVDPEKIANYDEAVKYLASYAMNQPGAANSDMHLGLAQTANASTHINQEAAQRVVENALGLERMQQAAVTQFNEQHTDPNTGTVQPGAGAQFNQFMQKFASTHDPRGFSWDDQDPAQQQAALKSMTAADKRRLLESVTLARKYQLTGTPGG
jgi:hypothetical protein